MTSAEGSIFDLVDKEETPTGTIFDFVQQEDLKTEQERPSPEERREQEGIAGTLTRGAARLPLRVAEEVAGFPGTMVDIAEGISESLPSTAGILTRDLAPQEQNFVKRFGRELLKKVPRPKDIQKILSKLTQGYTDPHGEIEEFGDEVAKLSTFLIAGKNPAQVKNVISSLGRALVAKGAAKGVEKAGGGPISQFAAEIVGLGLPGMGKNIIPKAAQKEGVEFARKVGLAEKEITPLIQGEKKVRTLSKMTPRRGKTQRILKESKDAYGKLYKHMEDSAAAKTVLSQTESSNLITELEDKLRNMPSKVRKTIADDLLDLKSGPRSGKELINFYQDVGSAEGAKTKQLSTLKPIVKKYIDKIDPTLAKEFNLTNELVSNHFNIAGKLKPTLVSDLYAASVPLRLFLSISTGFMPGIKEAIGEVAAKKISQNLLLNPRFQNLGKQMVKAVNDNKKGTIRQLWKQMTKEVNKVDEKAAKKMSDEEIDSIIDRLSTKS